MSKDNFASNLSSSFTTKEKIKFFKSKWKREHISSFVLCGIIYSALIAALVFLNVDRYAVTAAAMVLPLVIYIILYNKMMIYVESEIYD